MTLEWKDIAKVVGAAAPIVGTLIGGPAGAAIGGMVASALGTANTPDAIQAAIATDPQAALKLAEFESDNKVKLQAMMYAHADNLLAADTAEVQANVADRASARQRETVVKDGTPAALAWIIVLASVSLGTAVVAGWVTQSPAQAALVGTVIGYVFSEAKQVLAYYFGSSAGSRSKDELLAKSIPAPTDVA